MGQITNMNQDVSNAMKSVKISIVSVMIIGASGAIAYNMLTQQSPRKMLPGSTAVRVQVKDIDLAEVSAGDEASSISRLVSQTQNTQSPPPDRALTASIQDQLTYLGFYKGPVDGQSGALTLAAIKLYQEQNSLNPTGQVSGKLLDHLKFTRKIADASNSTGSISPPAERQPDILKVQELLTLFGYMPGDADGVFGRSTQNAIRQFESDRAMPVTGQITTSLLQELGL